MLTPAPRLDFDLAPHATVCAAVDPLLGTDSNQQLLTAGRPSDESCEQLFLRNLHTIRRVVSAIARKRRLTPLEAEDFASEVQLRIINDDYAILRQFRARCTLRTFLTKVIGRIFLDYRIAEWGKWRPSARSRREGDLVVLLERLIVRDSLRFEEACTVLETSYSLAIDRDRLACLAAGFRARPRPRFVSDGELGSGPASHRSADDAIVGAEENGHVARATKALAAAVQTISSRDRLVLTLKFRDGLTVAAIARKLKMDQKHLYRRLDRVLDRLRAYVEAVGVSGPQVLPALGRSDADPVGIFAPDDEKSSEWSETSLVA